METFGRILDESSNEIYVFDAETLKFLRVNFGARENLQYSMEELFNLTPVDIKPEFTIKEFEGKIQPLRDKTTRKINFKTVHQRKDGTTYPVEVKLQLMHEETPPLFVAIIEDISERVKAEEKLHFKEFALDHAADAAYWLDFESGRLIYVNTQACQSLGYTREELLQMRVFDVDPNYPEEKWPETKAWLLGASPVKVQSRHRRKDGTEFPVDIRAHYISYQGKEYLIAFARDISESVKANEALRCSEERLQLALEAATDGLWDWNIKTGEVYFSPRWMTMLGYEPDELEQAFSTWENLVHPEDLLRCKEMLNQHLEGKMPVYQAEVRMKARNGEWFWILTRGRVFERDEAGNPIRAVGTHADITRLKETEGRLKEATEKAEKANRAKSEFLSRMSHELRTPLNAILGFAQLLQMNAGDQFDTGNKESLGHILEGGRHLLELINEVLDLSRIEAGKLELNLQPVYVPGLIRETLKQLNPLRTALNIEVRIVDLTQGNDMVLADSLRFRQICINLISNAFKYNLPGGSVMIRMENTAEDCLAIHVEDTGIGIPQDKIQSIFEPFDRLNGRDSGIEGTGIGLTITRSLVEMMNGNLRVCSELGKGSRFSLEFPRAQSSENSPAV